MNSQEGLKDTFRNMRKQGSEPTMVTQSMENILAKTFRLRADRVYIPALKNSHPAFMFWLEKLKPNEKLPRGKFFKRYAFIKVHTKTGHCVSVEAASAGIKQNGGAVAPIALAGASGLIAWSNKIMFKTSLAMIVLVLSSHVFAVGVPVINPDKPIKISESTIYSCDKNGNALETGSPMRYKNKPVTCRNDNLWADDKALNFIDLAEDYFSNSKAATQAVINTDAINELKQIRAILEKNEVKMYTCTDGNKQYTAGVYVTIEGAIYHCKVKDNHAEWELVPRTFKQ